jgi:CHAT domain-containing protein/tetratricopeptide (TPR) repeat protein
MPVGVTIPIADGALGHSVILEELKGDFTRALQAAERARKAAVAAGQTQELAEALSALGVVHLLRGELSDALTRFGEADRSVAADPRLAVRSAGYQHLAAYLRFNYLPNGAGSGGAEFDARQEQFLSSVGKQSELRSTALPQIRDPALLLESALVGDLLTNLLSARSFTGSPDLLARDGAEQLLQTALQLVGSFQQQAAALDAEPSLLAYAQLAAADLARRARQGPMADQLLSEAERMYRASGDPAGVALCLMTRGDWLCAPFTSPLVWNHAMQEGIQSSRLAWSIESVELDRTRVDASSAAALFDEADSLFGSVNAPRGTAAVQLRRGYLAVLEGRYDRAVELSTAAATAFESAGDGWGVQVARAHRALSLVGLGGAPEDLAGSDSIGAWGKRTGSFSFALGLGLLFAREGRSWLMRDGDYERALACYRLAVALFEALAAGSNAAQALVDQGEAYRIVGDGTAALEKYEKAWEWYLGAATAPAPPTISRERGLLLGGEIYNLYLDRMDPEGMAETATRVEGLLALPAKGGSGGGAIPGFDIGALLGPTDPVGQGIRSIVAQNEALVPLYRGVQARDAGDAELAARHFQAATEAAERAPPGEREFLRAVVLGTAHRYDEAAEAYRRHLGGAAPPGGSLMETMLGLLGGAERAQAEARQQEQNVHEQAAAMFTRVRAYSDARRHLDALEEIGGPRWWAAGPRPWESLSDYGEVLEGLGSLSDALEYYERAIGELEARRGLLSLDELKTALAGGRGAQFLYFQAARTAMKLEESMPQGPANGSPGGTFMGKVFEFAERGKARALLDLLAASATHQRSSGTESDALRSWREATSRMAAWRGLLALERGKRPPEGSDPERIARLTEQIRSGERELHALRQRLATSDPEVERAVSSEADIMSVDRVSAALGEGILLLQYYFLGEDLLAWAISSRGVLEQHRAAMEPGALERRIRALHRAYADGTPVDGVAEELSEVFLAPFSRAIDGASQLLLVPFGAAHALPFHALPWKGDPLVANRAVSYIPSASVLQFLESDGHRKASGPLLAVGDPSNMAAAAPAGGAPRPVASLPASAVEAAFVATLVPNGRVLLGDRATEAAVREGMPASRIVHLATHGVLSEDLPLLSSVLLANGESLTVLELMGLRLDADLVVLSACRTGLGDTTRGDDVLGLTRGLLAAGARSAIVSLWPVDDVSTSLLMGEFYRRLLDGQAPPVALQGAQNHLRTLTAAEIVDERRLLARAVAASDLPESVGSPDGGSARDVLRPRAPATAANDYRHPHHWAPFVFVGR